MRRAQQKEQTKKLLQQTAIELFKRQGYGKTTVSQITATAGVAKGTFFNYFESKQAVLHTIQEQQAEYMEKEAEKIFEEEGKIKEGLYRLWENIALHLEESGRPLIRSLYHVLITDESFQRKEVLQSRKFEELLILLFEEGRKRNEFADNFYFEQFALMMVHHFTGVLFYWCTSEDSLPLSTLIRQSMPLLFKGISIED
ncbi:TetR/AcrR family transcriptional regulator [Priestia abyssalis]|uniref:TetR/AcrR family transcriptional regulator n=1 Tax=Priestia abyssalis TaxID=1221450 RepID=UPI0009952470|nr:TetR/AcrR family transcriptional regulator [Priestia abyssalis]